MTRVEAAIVELRAALAEELTGEMVGILRGVGPRKATKKPARSAAFATAREEIKAIPREKPRMKLRPTDEIERLAGLALEFIKKNPGLKAKGVADGIGVSVIDARFPLRKLKEANKIKTKGERLETAYYPK